MHLDLDLAVEALLDQFLQQQGALALGGVGRHHMGEADHDGFGGRGRLGDGARQAQCGGEAGGKQCFQHGGFPFLLFFRPVRDLSTGQ
ncbi:hypothetical protein D3C78_1158610 [compost metagenome]